MARAASTAALVTAILLVLVLSRSEIRRTLLTGPLAVPLLALGVWIAVFLVIRWRQRDRGP